MYQKNNKIIQYMNHPFESDAFEWNAVESAVHMLEEGNPNYKQSEWIGWYFEHQLSHYFDLHDSSSPYDIDIMLSQNVFIDAKTHCNCDKNGRPNDKIILNDAETIDRLLADGNQFGFLILSGDATFGTAHKQWKESHFGISAYSANNRKRGAPSRLGKNSFRGTSLALYTVGSEAERDSLLESGSLYLVRQGRNSNGLPRPLKYGANLTLFTPAHWVELQ